MARAVHEAERQAVQFEGSCVRTGGKDLKPPFLLFPTDKHHIVTVALFCGGLSRWTKHIRWKGFQELAHWRACMFSTWCWEGNLLLGNCLDTALLTMCYC